jgi:hypothetical protein
MEDRSSRRLRTLVTPTARRGLSANEVADALISMMAGSTMSSNQRPDTFDARPSHHLDKHLLRRTAGPYNWVTSVALCDRWLPIDFRYAPFATQVLLSVGTLGNPSQDGRCSIRVVVSPRDGRRAGFRCAAVVSPRTLQLS